MLQKAIKAANMENASFGGSRDVISLNGGPPEPLDAFIKERTRLYRQSWIVAPLNTVMAWAVGERKLR